jgi:hypothetical protein
MIRYFVAIPNSYGSAKRSRKLSGDSNGCLNGETTKRRSYRPLPSNHHHMPKKKSSKPCTPRRTTLAEIVARESGRCRLSLMRAIRKEGERIVQRILWHLEALASREDVERLREQLQDMRRPR